MSQIVTSFDQLQQIIPTIIGNGEFSMYAPYVDDAEDYVRNEILGSTLFDLLDDTHSDSSGPIAAWIEARRMTANVICLKAYSIAIPFIDLVQTPNGFAVMSNANQAPASKDRVKALRAGVDSRLGDALESLLRYLDNNLDTFNQWEDAPSFTQRYDMLIHSAKDFQTYLNINSSHRLYLAMLPSMKYAEDLHINSTLSEDLIDQIKLEVVEDVIGESNEKILEDLKNACANLTMAVAIERLSLRIEPDGIKLAYSIGETSVSDVNRNKVLSDKFLEQGKFYLDRALQYVLNNLSSFPAYTGSDIYDDQTAGYNGFENAETDTIFAAGI